MKTIAVLWLVIIPVVGVSSLIAIDTMINDRLAYEHVDTYSLQKYSETLHVHPSGTEQPYGLRYEDQERPVDYAQPTDVSKPQVTLHGQLIQGGLQ